jgi:glycosyltransferase involved in cell wall biosynthesis
MLKRRIKVLQLITTTIGGAGEHVLMLASGLDPEQFDVTVGFSPGYPLDHAFYEAGLRIVPIEMQRTGGIMTSIKAYRALRELLHEEHFDIVHTHTSVAGVIGRLAARQSGIPVIVHMIHAYACHPYVRQPKRWLYRQVERWLDRFTDHYIAGSDYIRAYGIANRIMPPEKITRIYYAFRHERLKDSPNRNVARRDLGLPVDAPVAGVIARLERQKGVIFFIRALPKVLQQIPKAHFIIAGDGPLRSMLYEEAARLNILSHLHFLGWREDVGRVLASLDVTVLPSLWEAFGIISVESMAMGVPVIASRVGGIPEVVRDGETGLLVSPENSDELGRAIISLLADPAYAQRLGLQGIQWVSTQFSLTNMVQAHQRIYYDLLSNSG